LIQLYPIRREGVIDIRTLLLVFITLVEMTNKKDDDDTNVTSNVIVREIFHNL